MQWGRNRISSEARIPSDAVVTVNRAAWLAEAVPCWLMARISMV